MKRYLGPILMGCAALILIVIGAVLVVGKVSEVAGLIPAATWQTPGEQTVSLEAGEYAVSELAGFDSSSDFGSPSTTAPSTISNEDVTVTGPDGPVLTRCANCGYGSEELTVGGSAYNAVTHFDVRKAGDYTVSVAGGPATVIVNRSVSSVLSGIGPAFAPIGVGGLLAIAAIIWALILLFMGKGKGSSGGSGYVGATYPQARPVGPVGTGPPGAVPPGAVPPGGMPATANPYGAGAPAQPAQPASANPGWFPDPSQPGLQRWWDGNQWTRETFRP